MMAIGAFGLLTGACCLALSLVVLGACGKVKDPLDEGEQGLGGQGGDAGSTTGEGAAQGCASLSEDECRTANLDTEDYLDDCEWVLPVRVGHIEEGRVCSERDGGTCTERYGANCGDQDAGTRWTDDTGTVWHTHDGCGLPEFERYDGSSRDIFPCASGEPQQCASLSELVCNSTNLDNEDYSDDCKWVEPVRKGHIEEGGVCSERDGGTCTERYGANCGDQDAETHWTDDSGTVWETSDGCGLPEFERHDGSSHELFSCDSAGGNGGND